MSDFASYCAESNCKKMELTDMFVLVLDIYAVVNLPTFSLSSPFKISASALP